MSNNREGVEKKMALMTDAVAAAIAAIVASMAIQKFLTETLHTSIIVSV